MAQTLFLHYHPDWAPSPYPGVACISVNDAAVHGIPGHHRLVPGDLVSVDCGARLDGWSGDAAISFIVGAHPDPEIATNDAALIATTQRALDAGIAASVPGARLGDIAHAIGQVGRAAGYGLMEDHGGHGIGRSMHEAPFVPNEGRPGRGLRLKPGLVLALEPMLAMRPDCSDRRAPPGRMSATGGLRSPKTAGPVRDPFSETICFLHGAPGATTTQGQHPGPELGCDDALPGGLAEARRTT